MIWALLALLGVPIWLVLGALGGALYSRRSFRSQEDAITLMVRSVGDESWPRGPSYGHYVHDVLIVRRGLALIRTSIHVVERAEPLDLDGASFKHLDHPIGYTLTLDDDEQIEVAVERAADPVGASVRS